MGIVDHMSGNSAHVAVLARKTLVSWEIEDQTHCAMGEGVGGRFGLAWTNVDFRELVSNGKLLGEDDPCQPHG